MSRRQIPGRAVALAFAIALCGCVESTPSASTVLAGPEVQAATVACEQRYAAHELTSLTQVAQCERTLALPQQEDRYPGLSPLYQGIWHDKIALYGKVDRGQLTQAEADRLITIEGDNWYTNVVSVERDTH
jgi:hypothetical protein